MNHNQDVVNTNSCITLLTKNTIVTKTFSVENGFVKKTGFDTNGGTYFANVEYVPNLQYLYEGLLQIAGNSNMALTMDVPKPQYSAPYTKLKKSFHDKENQIGYFEHTPKGSCLVGLDIDKALIPDGFSLIDDPVACIDAVLLTKFPSYLHNASYVRQLSSSAGVHENVPVSEFLTPTPEDEIKAHVWFMFNKPISQNALKVWAKRLNAESIKNGGLPLLDQSFYDAVRIIYTADPIFLDGLPDPFKGNRIGYVKKENEIVEFPEELYKEVIELGKNEANKSNEIANPYTGEIPNCGIYDVPLFKEKLALFGYSQSHTIIWEAITAYCYQVGANNVDDAALLATIHAHINNIDFTKHKKYNKFELQQLVNDDSYYNWLKKAKSYAHTAYGDKPAPVKAKKVPFYPRKKKIPKEDAQTVMTEKMFDALLEPKSVNLIITGGTGKTVKAAAITRNAWLHDKTIAMYTADHKLGHAYYKLLTEGTHGNISGCRATHCYGRTYDVEKTYWFQEKYAKELAADPDFRLWIDDLSMPQGGYHYSMCHFKEEVEILQAKGYPVWGNLCNTGKKVKDAKGNDVQERCEYFTKCHYNQQYLGKYNNSTNKFEGKDWDAMIFSHDTLVLERTFLDSEVERIAMVDETCAKKVFVEKTLTLEHIYKAPITKKLKEILFHADVNAPILDIIREQYTNEGIVTEIVTAQEMLKEQKKNLGFINQSKEVKKSLIASLPPANPIEHVLECLLVELKLNRSIPYSFGRAFHYEKGGVMVKHPEFSIKYRSSLPRLKDVESIISINSDDIEDIHDVIFPNTEHHRIPVKRNKRLIWVYDKKFNITNLTKKAYIADNINYMNSFMQKLADQGRTFLLIASQEFTGNENPNNKRKAKLTMPTYADPSKKSYFGHWGAIRGNDEWKDVDVIITYGYYQPPLYTIEQDAKALVWDKDIQLDLYKEGEKMDKQERYQRYESGFIRKTEGYYHKDKFIDSLNRIDNELQILQGFDRGRLIWDENPKDLFAFLGDEAVDEAVDVGVTRDEAQTFTTPLTTAFVNNGGCLVISPTWLGTHCKVQMSEHSWNNYLKRNVGGTTKEALLGSLWTDTHDGIRLIEFTDKSNGSIRKVLTNKSDEDTMLFLNNYYSKPFLTNVE